MTPDPQREALGRFCQFFETLNPQALSRLEEFYSDDASFKDPFNDVRGVAAIRSVFEHMFESLDEPRFLIDDRLIDGSNAFVTWRFVFRFKRFSNDVEQTVRGGSQLHFADDGRVRMHCDYWDAAGELYAKLPLIGALMRWLNARVGGP